MPNCTMYYGLGSLYLLVGLLSGGLSGALMVWGAVSFMVVGAGYSAIGPVVFGKQSNGTMSLFNVLVLLPYLFFARVTWCLRRYLSSEPCCNEIAPGVWLGRRPVACDLPSEVTMVVDLTAEFDATRTVRNIKRYLCVPTLDGCAPEEHEFLEIMRELAQWNEPVYIHCAHGHGRSALVVVALVKAKGLAHTIDEALLMVQKIRPKVNLKKPQRALLDKWEAGLLQT